MTKNITRFKIRLRQSKLYIINIKFYYFMTKSREEYSENLESQYRNMERVFNKIIADFEGKKFSKSSRERLDDVYNFFQICYHLREWVRKNNKVDKKIEDNLPTFEKNDSPIQFLNLPRFMQSVQTLCA